MPMSIINRSHSTQGSSVFKSQNYTLLKVKIHVDLPPHSLCELNQPECSSALLASVTQLVDNFSHSVDNFSCVPQLHTPWPLRHLAAYPIGTSNSANPSLGHHLSCCSTPHLKKGHHHLCGSKSQKGWKFLCLVTETQILLPIMLTTPSKSGSFLSHFYYPP